MTRVLIVDDKPDNLYYLQALLGGHGYEVVAARHGAEALTKARQDPPDLVVSDLLMPVMDGYTLLRHWKADARLREAPFIVYTATYTEPQDEQLALDLGADAFILKPSEPDAFMQRLEEVLAGVTEEPPSVPRLPAGDDDALLETYSETLIRKLEEKSLELERTNRALRRDLEERQRAEAERLRLVHDLGERVKELRALREAGRILRDDHLPLGDLLARVVALVPPAMQYPEVTAARIACDGLERTAGAWRESEWSLAAAFTLEDGRQAVIEVVYLEELPPADDGPFLKEERDLLDALADTLRAHLVRRQAQEALREQAALLDKAQDAILVRDLEHRVRYWNKSAERLYGWTAAEARGRTMVDLLYEDAELYRRAHDELLQRGEWTGELLHRTKAGDEIAVEARWTLVRDGEGRPKEVLAINTDISQRRHLEAQMMRAQRLESIGTLAGGIAHDLNNVLTPILMSLEVLRDAVHEASARDVLDLVERSAQRGADMVRQVMTFARGLDARRVQLHLRQVTRDVEHLVKETFPKDVRCEVAVPEDLWMLEADPTQLHQVLLNLCVNARDAMPGGGRLRLAAQNLLLDHAFVAANLEAREGPWVRITVEDTGSGIPDELVERIFDPFFTTKEVGKGTGLGLATSLAIVKGHGGFMRVASEPAVGTRMEVYLPARRHGPSADAAPASAPPPRGRGELVLVIEDEVAVREITRRILEANGYRAIVAPDGAEGVALFRRHREEVALVLTDMMMPVMDGPQVIRILRQLDPRLRIIAASGLDSHRREVGEPGLDVRHFLTKPYPMADLLRTVREALDAAPPPRRHSRP